MIYRRLLQILIIIFIFSTFHYSCLSHDNDDKQLSKNVEAIVDIIIKKDSNALLDFIPNINFEVWSKKYLTKNEIEKDFKSKGRIYRLVFCGEIIGETEPLCMRDDLNGKTIRIKKILKVENERNTIAELDVTWYEKEKEKMNKNNITPYLDKFTFVKIESKWFLNDFKVWEGF